MEKFKRPELAYALLIFSMILINSDVFAQDAQFRGPNRDGIFPDTALLEVWPEGGPEVLFLTEGLGRGYSSAIVGNGIVYATGTKDSTEILTAMDLKGNILWQKSYGRAWKNSFPEARCTPTLEGDRLYTLTGMDDMTCFNAKTGDVIWKVDIQEEYKSSLDMFGVSESLLIVDNKIITTPAGDLTTVIALDKMTGELIWKSESIGAKRSNMSPVLIDHCDKEYFITSTQTHLHGVDIENGEILWSYQYNFLDKDGNNSTIFTNIPTYKDSCLWVSNGWDTKSVMLKIAPDGKSVSEKFTDYTFDNQNHGVVLLDSFLYGSNFTGRNTGKWVCMNWNTSEIVWIEDFHNKGPIIYADGMLYLYEEKRGNMALVKASPKEFEVISTFRVTEGKGAHWARPAIYNQVLYVRHGDVLIAYDIASQQ